MTSPDYTCISKRAKTAKVTYRNPCRGPVTHLMVDATGLKVYGEGERKTRKRNKEKRRTWLKLHLAIDAETHEVIAAEVSLVNVGDNEVLPTLLNPRVDELSRFKQTTPTTPRIAKNCSGLMIPDTAIGGKVATAKRGVQ